MTTSDPTQRTHYIVGGNLDATNAAPSALGSAAVARRVQALLAQQGKPAQVLLAPENIRSPHELSEIADAVVADPRAQIVFFLPTADDAAMNAAWAKIRASRKDLFFVLASPTQGATPEEQYTLALSRMKTYHANLALARDAETGLNMVAVPEEAMYAKTTELDETLTSLVKIATARAGATFTRSTMIDAPLVAWNSPDIPANFRRVVDEMVKRGVYRKLNGKTAGHFAIRGKQEGEFLTSIRSSDFNALDQTGLVRIVARNNDEVIAYGAKPSVGGQSQRIIFGLNPALNNIVHFHSPLRTDAADVVPVREQWPNECGSHQCGQNTADGLREVRPGIFAVMLDNHGPNIVFGDAIPAERVIDFITDNFDLTQKTGGPFAEPMRHLLRSEARFATAGVA